MSDILRMAILALILEACTSDDKRLAETAQWVGPLVDSIAAKASAQGIPATGAVMIDASSFAHALRDIAPGIDAKQIDEWVSDSVERTTAEQSVECAGASCVVRGRGVYIHMESVRPVEGGHRVF